MAEAMVQLNPDTLGFEARPDLSGAQGAQPGGDGQGAGPSSAPGPAWPGVLIMHEITGVNDYIKEVAQKLAENGYLALAVDLFGGKVAQGMEDGAPLREGVTDEIFQTKVGAAVEYLKGHPQCSGKLGVVGFCMGGGNALRTACLFGADVQACSMFYGRIGDLKLLEGLQGPVIGNFGGEDKGITEWAIHEFRPAMQNMNKSLNMKVYPGAPHGFAGHLTPNRYKPEAANDAWDRTLTLFGRTLKPAGAVASGWGRR